MGVNVIAETPEGVFELSPDGSQRLIMCGRLLASSRRLPYCGITHANRVYLYGKTPLGHFAAAERLQLPTNS